MTTPLQQQLTPGDHQYFEWSTSKQQTNLLHPLMTHNTHRRNYYQHYEEKHSLDDNQLKPNKTITTSPTPHIKKKQKLNEIESNDELNHLQTCYPFQAELTQKIDIECDGGSNTNQTTYPPTHHFTLSTVINVSVNGQTQKSLDIVPSSSQQYPIKSHEHPQSSSSSSPSLIPYSELNLSLYLKDIDLTTLDAFILPSCPNPQDYLTVDGLLTFLMSDKHIPKQLPMNQMYNYSRIQQQQNRYPYQQQYLKSQYYDYPQQNLTGPMETNTPSYYRQSSLPQQMTKYYSTTTSTSSFR